MVTIIVSGLSWNLLNMLYFNSKCVRHGGAQGSDTLNLIKAVLVSYLLGKVHLSSHEAETVDYLEGRGVNTL